MLTVVPGELKEPPTPLPRCCTRNTCLILSTSPLSADVVEVLHRGRLLNTRMKEFFPENNFEATSVDDPLLKCHLALGQLMHQILGFASPPQGCIKLKEPLSSSFNVAIEPVITRYDLGGGLF